MRARSRLLCLLLLVAAPAQAAPSTGPAGSLFRQEKRLQAPITLRVRDQPLSDLLADLGKRTGVRLRATRLTGDDRVTLFVRDRPAAEVLARIAGHFDFQWTREGETYELGQSLAAQNRERKLRENEAAEQLQAMQEHLNRLQALVQTPRERLEARQKELVASLRHPSTVGERPAIGAELQRIGEVLAPGAAPSLGLFRQLNAAQLAQLTASGQLRLSTASGTLSPAAAEQIHRAAAEMMQSGRVIRIGEAAGNPGAPGSNPENEPPTGATAVITLDEGYQTPPGGSQLRRSLSLRFVLSSLRGDAGRRSSFPVIWMPRPGSGGQAGAGPTPTEDSELKQPVELTQAQGPAPVAPPPPAPAGPFLIAGGPVLRPDVTPLSRALELLHEKTGLEILSDSFVHTRVRGGTLASKRPVAELLDGIRDELDYEWGKEGRLLTLRARRYYRHRPEEIPERLTRIWKAQLSRSGMFNLDDLAAMLAAISDPQTRSLQGFWSWYLESPGVTPPEAPHGLFDNRFHLRFWATLTAPQRAAARAEILPAARMNVGQRNAFALALASRSGPMIQPDEAESLPSPEALAAGGFTLKSGQATMKSLSGVGENGARVAIRLQGGPPGAALPRIPGGLNGGDVQFDNVQVTTLDSYNFHYHVAGNPRPVRVASIQVPRPAPKTESAKP